MTVVVKIRVGSQVRDYTMTEQSVGPALRESLLSRGWDGTMWIGEALPVGRQRKAHLSLFYRTPAGLYGNALGGSRSA